MLARAAALGFGLLLVAALAGFWKPYLSRLAEVPLKLTHLHAALVGAWCLLLVVQPALVASGRRPLHRALGRSAWLLAPAIVVGSVLLAVQMTRPAAGAAIEPFRFGLFPLQLATAAIFGGCAAMALLHRRDAARHARWMVASGLTFIDPVFARVFGFFSEGWPWLMEYGSTLVADAAALLLVAVDRRGRAIFASLLAALLVMQLLWLALPSWEPWRRWMEGWFLP